jgi:hypothetical protein
LCHSRTTDSLKELQKYKNNKKRVQPTTIKLLDNVERFLRVVVIKIDWVRQYNIREEEKVPKKRYFTEETAE